MDQQPTQSQPLSQEHSGAPSILVKIITVLLLQIGLVYLHVYSIAYMSATGDGTGALVWGPVHIFFSLILGLLGVRVARSGIRKDKNKKLSGALTVVSIFVITVFPQYLLAGAVSPLLEPYAKRKSEERYYDY